jgi:hypothetical protein
VPAQQNSPADPQTSHCDVAVAPKPEVRQTSVASAQVRLLPDSQQGWPAWPQALQAVPLSTAVHAKPVPQVPPAPPQQA